MEYFEAVQKRRSIRKFTAEAVPEEVIQRSLEAAVLAPNSSNVQTWDFYWIKNPDLKNELIKACLSQSAARTANHLIVVTADPKTWRRSHPYLLKWVEDSSAPKVVHTYYKVLIPALYRWGILNLYAPIKMLISFVIGIFNPIMRGPDTKRDLQVVAIKSAALACENLMLAITAQGYATCPMEGFDPWRVKKLLQLPASAVTVMIIAVGREGERGTWGPQMRIPLNEVVHTV